MGQILHGRARTTRETRREMQNSQQSLQKLAQKYGVNVKTVAKWKKRDYTYHTPMGPKQKRSTILTIEQEAAIVAFRKHTLLPLDDCLYGLQEAIPQLTRSSLHRCLQRHGVSRLPQEEENKQQGKKHLKSIR